VSRGVLSGLPGAGEVGFWARTGMIRLPWRPGPVRGHEGPVVVSATSLRLTRQRDRAPAMLAGMRLREGWYAMPGAIGLSLWASGRDSGSISVWADQESLRRFVGLPAHVEIMRAYRGRGELVSSTWTEESFDLDRSYAQALLRWRQADQL
jgi:hypothetical protein